MRAAMRFVCCALPLVGLAMFSAVATAQTESVPAIARETYRPKPALPPPAGAPTRGVTERLVAEPRVVAEAVPAPVVVAEKPVVVERVATPQRVRTWSDALARFRYGYYDDGNLDDNWYYDFYDPQPAVVVAPAVTRPSSSANPGYRTSWTYEPVAERGLFSW